MSERGKEFAELVYAIIVAERRFSAKSVASEMGLGYDAFYARIINRTNFSADEIRRLIRVAPDPRFVTWLLRGTRFVAADRASAAEDDDNAQAIHYAATRIVLEAADVLESVEKGLRDHCIDHRDALDIRCEIESAERALASLSIRLHRLLHQDVNIDVET